MKREMEVVGVKSDKIVQEIMAKIDSLLEDGYEMWREYGIPEESLQDRGQVVACAVEYYGEKEYVLEFAAACQCFYLFRCLHTMVEEYPEQVTLLGDYFFSHFSHFLIPIDSVHLIELFSDYLKEDAKRQSEGEKVFDVCRYLEFVKETAKELKE
jgi:hypothetical protein